MLDEDQLQQGFQLGEWRVLPRRRSLVRGDESVAPAQQVFEFLMAVVRRNGDIISRDELVDEVWGGRAVGEDVIDQAALKLRAVLGDRETPRRYVETVRGRGFRLVCDVVPDDTAQASEERESRVRVRRGPVVAAAAVLLVLFTLATVDICWPWSDACKANQQAAPPDSVAVLPFTNISDASNDVYLSGFREVLVDRLHRSGQYTVKSSSQAFSGDVSATAKALGVSHIVTGTLQVIGDDVQVQFEIIEGATGIVRYVNVVKGDVSDLFALQEELASELHTEVMGPGIELASLRPPDTAAYMAYIRGLYTFEHRIEPGNNELAIDYLEETVSLDESFAPAWLRLAYAYALLPDNAVTSHQAAWDKALAAATRAVDIEPGLRGPASAVLGFVNYKQRNWGLAGKFFEESLLAGVPDAGAYHLYSRMLSGAGMLDHALEQAMLALEMTPTSPTINSRVALIHTWRGDVDAAAEYFELSALYGATGITHDLAYAIHVFRLGDLEAARASIETGLSGTGLSSDWVGPVFAALGDPSRAAEAIRVIDAESQAGRITPQMQLILRTATGDIDGAMRVARLLEDSEQEPFAMDILWAPELAPLRARPEFTDLMASLNLSPFWAAEGCQLVNAEVTCRP